jgi:transposase InsO family protein
VGGWAVAAAGYDRPLCFRCEVIEPRLGQDYAWSQREGAAWAASPELRKPDCPDVVAMLERIASVHRGPLIRVENGPEFISNELDLRAWLHGVDFDFSRPGKPTDNAFAASFNGRSRESAGTTSDPQPGRCVAELRGLAEGLQ